MKIRFVSYGLKYGKQNEGNFNIFFDVRFLKNPFWESSLKSKTGLDLEVQEYIMADSVAQDFVKNLFKTIEHNVKNWNRTEEYVVGVACTGGQHRSVTIVEKLYEHFSSKYQCIKEHLTINKFKEPILERTFEQQPRVVAIGGGNGLSNLLGGLAKFPLDLTAIVTVADNGGSTGDIRKWFEMPAPGDIRRVLLAMSKKRELFESLFNFRFSKKNANLIGGHTVGNIVIAALNEMNGGNFIDAVDELSEMLEIKGKIMPVSNEPLDIGCVYEDGTVVIGESVIPSDDDKKIKEIFYNTKEATVNKNAIDAIVNADIVVFSPGSLYTSLIPNLLFEEIKDALKRTTAKIIYVSNLTTQKGETIGYTVEEHLRSIEKTIGCDLVKNVILNSNVTPPNKEIEKHFESSHISLVTTEQNSDRYIYNDIIKYEQDGDKVVIKHNDDKVAYMVFKLAYEKVFNLG